MPGTSYDVYDIWQNQSIGTARNSLTLEVEPHGARLIKLK